MKRDEALDKIAWHALKRISRDEAEIIIHEFFKAPEIREDLKNQLNITVIAQWHTHTPPPDLKPGNSIYRPILLDKMKARFKGYTNTYLTQYLDQELGLKVEALEGDLPHWLACPVCEYHTFPALGTWLNCPVCGWNSDPMQEALPTEAIGQNGISLLDARENYAKIGAISEAKKAELDPQAKDRYPKGA